jgi:hypothetical protein
LPPYGLRSGVKEARVDWRIKQEGLVVASGNAEPEAAKREAARYALVYAQDGPPVEMYYRTGKRWKFITSVEVVRDSGSRSES